jgi:hypothetical protein
MGRKDEQDMLRKHGFAEDEVILLRRLRTSYKETIRHEQIEEHRRLEFARWLVTTGKLSEQIA